MKKYLLFVALYIICFNSFSQEVLSPMEINPVIKNYLSRNGMQNAYRSNAVSVPLPLPFLDDFSSTEVYPSSFRWIDNNIFINSTFGRVMPTVGVATFDGLDALGGAYIPGSTISGSCDTLTSQPLQMFTKASGGNYTIADSMFVSFFYQKQGFGDEPEANDSLILEFYRPSSGTWTRNWFSLGNVPNGSGQDTVFNKVDILITDTTYLQDGFQLRFRSYGNRSGSLDHWHVDYLRVFALSEFLATIVDQAFLDDKKSNLETFTSIPWKHYKNIGSANQPNLIKDNESVYYNIYHQQIGVNGHFGQSVLAPNLNPVYSYSSPTFPTTSNLRQTHTFSIPYFYPDAQQLNDDSSYFDLIDYFADNLTPDPIKSNDTIRYRQYFYNYYSYDDGSCENAYDLNNAPNGKVAVQYNMLESDTLRGVQIFFAQQNADVSNKLITLKVWSSLGPEVVLYQLPSQHPTYIDSINGFATYVFPGPFAVKDFYIGFQQVSADLLHLGFDRNTPNNSKMFYNISGTWSNVGAAQGSFMIRPLVGSDPLVSINENSTSPSVNCYPNPSSGSIYISPGNNNIYQHIVVSDLSGRTVFESDFQPGWFDLSSLTTGLYTVQLSGDGITTLPKKMIINK